MISIILTLLYQNYCKILKFQLWLIGFSKSYDFNFLVIVYFFSMIKKNLWCHKPLENKTFSHRMNIILRIKKYEYCLVYNMSIGIIVCYKCEYIFIIYILYNFNIFFS